MFRDSMVYYFWRSRRPFYQKPYQFSTDWFTRRIPRWDHVFRHLKGKPQLQALEIGTFEGRSALWLLENVLTAETSQLYCIDPYLNEKKSAEEQFRQNIKLGGYEKKIQLFVSASQDILPTMLHKSFDFIYIDGDHEGEQVEIDAILSWPLLKESGLMIFDDYRMRSRLSHKEQPRKAILRFLKEYRYSLKVIHKGYQVIIEKISAPLP